MVEHRPWNDIIAYAILTLGVFIVASGLGGLRRAFVTP